MNERNEVRVGSEGLAKISRSMTAASEQARQIHQAQGLRINAIFAEARAAFRKSA